jgi:hypothetical protein
VVPGSALNWIAVKLSTTPSKQTMKPKNMTIPSLSNSISRPPLRRGLPGKQQLPRTRAMWIIRGFLLSALTLAFAYFALSPAARAVDPPPDGGYPNFNTAEGEDALFSLTDGFYNTAIGFDALFSDTVGLSNTAIGFDALYSDTSGSANTATGDSALFSNTSGGYNTAHGFEALNRNTTGDLNTANGGLALTFNTTGSHDTANGFDALTLNTTGSFNTATGAVALEFNTEGSFNTATGAYALLFSKTGSNNTATGYGALHSNTTGSLNTANGVNALFGNTTGNSNIALGLGAGGNLTTGDNNIDIGNSGVAAEANTIRIGKHATQTAAFISGISGATVTGRAVVVNSAGQLGVAPSSARFKDGIKPMDKASEAILALKPVTFRYKHELDPVGIPQFGLVAEQVEKVNPDLVARDADGKVYTVRYEAVNAMLLNEFLKEHRKVEEQGSQMTKQNRKVQELEATVAQQQKQIEALTAGLQKVSAQVEMSKPASQMVLNNQ